MMEEENTIDCWVLSQTHSFKQACKFLFQNEADLYPRIMVESGNQPFTLSNLDSRYKHTYSMTALWCSLLLQTIGCTAPGWMFLRLSNGNDIHIGLWWILTCGNVKACESESTGHYGSYLKYGERYSNDLTVYRVVVVTGVVLCLVSLQILDCGILSKPQTYQKFTCSTSSTAFASFMSGVAAIFASAKIGLNNINIAIDYSHDNPISFPYALFITGIGGILALTVGFNVLKIFCEEKQQQELHNYTEQYPGFRGDPNNDVVEVVSTDGARNANGLKTAVMHM